MGIQLLAFESNGAVSVLRYAAVPQEAKSVRLDGVKKPVFQASGLANLICRSRAAVPDYTPVVHPAPPFTVGGSVATRHYAFNRHARIVPN